MRKLFWLLLLAGLPVSAQVSIQGTGIKIGGTTTGGSPAGPSNALQTNAGSGLFGNSGCTAISGAITCPGTGGAGRVFLGQGTSTSTVAGSVGLTVPASVTTPYNFIFPAAPPVSASQTLLCTDTTGQTACAWGTGAGGLTGQTINFLPLAASTTTSTSSSHFFEASGMSGVNNPFTMTAAAPNCIATGAGFTQFACNHMGMSDDGSSANHFLFGFSMGLNAWGPGGGYKLGDTVGFENRGNTLFGGTNMTALVTAGQKSGYYNNLSAYGLGDAQPGFNYVNNCQTGLGYSSDEGCSNRLRLGETIGEWSSTITSGTNTQPLFTAGGGQCQGYENQACAPAPGTVMIDTSVVRASGHVTSAPSSGALGLSWLSQSTTDFAPPTSTAWGFHTAINYTPSASTTWDAPVSATFLIGGGAGTFAAGDHACMIGANFTEQNIISAVSGTAPNQTITMPLVMPETDIAIFKGDCMFMDLDADAAQGVHYALAAVSVDGTNIVYTYPSHGFNLPSPIPVDGSTFSLFGADPTRSGVHLYAGARITKVSTANPGGAFPFNVPDIRIFLAPNSAFAVGDVLLNPHFAAQGVTTLDMITEQNQAPTSSGQPTGVSSSLVGKAISTFARAYFGVNANSNSLYKQYGGLLNEPRFIFQQGLFDSFAQADTTPLTSVFRFNAHQTGQTSYNILSDPTWGELSINNSNQVNFSGTGGFATAGPLTGSLVTGTTGLASGVGDGAGNYAGVSMAFKHNTLTPTFLAPCSEEPFSSTNTDLCVTSQGASRSSYLLTADRGLKASAFNSVSLEGISHFSCINDASSTCYTGASTPASGVPGFDFQTNAQTMGGTFGNGGNISIIANTPGDTATGGFINLFGSGRGDASKDTVGIGNSSGQGIEIDGTFTGHNPNYVGIFYPAGSIIPQPFSVNGSIYMPSGNALQWNGDTGFSRTGAGLVALGNGTQGSTSGSLTATNLSATNQITAQSTIQAINFGPATNVANFNSPAVQIAGSFWNGSVSGTDAWSLTNVLGTGTNPASALTFSHAGSTGIAAVKFSLTGPATLYSAAGTALPTCAVALNGYEATVTDATTPTYMGAYTSGGAITTKVICSFNGTTYSWKTH